ncbi:MAG: type III polyketide synthase [Bacteriovorax sp.]|nr:type III polyketide synthase [Bacteriovorax sp.]
MAAIHSVCTTFPKIYESQENIAKEIGSIWPDKQKHVDQFHQASQVKGRHLSIPLSEYKNLGDIGERSKKWLETAVELQTENIQKLLDKAGLSPADISLIVSTTVTGLAIPTLEARLMNKLPFKPNTKRIPIFGLGCLGGVAGINRVNDYLLGHPEEAALLIATELCSLTFQFHDKSVANLVGTSLFADGAAAVLMLGEKHPLYNKAQFKVLNSESFFYPDTERIMGWDIISSGFQIVLSGDVPKIVVEQVKPNLESFLSQNKIASSDVNFMVSHPGGPKVLDKLSEVSGRAPEDFIHSWTSLREKGNMSSVSVLHVLEKTIGDQHKRNEIGLMLAMGPAFCSEMCLIKKI